MNKKKIEEISKKLQSSFGPTFCLEKYHSVTLHLHIGQTHSCFHPKHHKIPLEELKKDPSALHNTSQKKQERAKMLQGQKISGCEYCWKIEKLGDKHISDRHQRSATAFNQKRVKEIRDKGPNHNYNPRYVEVSFGNTCNFKCGYCSPKASSAYYQEIQKHGIYSMVQHNKGSIDFEIYPEDDNPYIDAWWEWWPELKNDLEILRITGGEPLLQKSTWDLIESIQKDPLPHLELSINSNMGIPGNLVKNLNTQVNKLQEKNKIGSFLLFTSLDTRGTKAEYIRTGLDLETWEANVLNYLENTQGKISFMITVNILAVSNLQTLLKKILQWKKKYILKKDGKRESRILFDTPHLKNPIHYDINLLPKKDFLPYMYDTLNFIKKHLDNNDPTKFREIEYFKFKRVVDYMEQTQYSKLKLLQGRADFYSWFQEHDKRRGSDFAKTFPEYADFMKQCEKNYKAKLFFQSQFSKKL